MITLTVFFTLLMNITAYAENVYFPIKSLSDQWQVYDEKYDAYVPYINSRHKNHNTISLLIDPLEYKGLFVRYYASRGLSVFFDNKIYKNYFTEGYDEISYDLLNKVKKDKRVLLTFVGPKDILPFKSTSIVSVKHVLNGNESLQADSNEVLVIPRDNINYSSYYLLMILFVCAAYIFQKYASYTTFVYIYNPKSLIGRERMDELNAHSDLDKFQIIYMILNCVCMSMVIITGYYRNPSLIEKSFIGEVLSLSTLLLMGYAAKYVFLQICGFVFDVPKLVKVQYFEFLRLTLIFSLAMFLMTLLFFSPFAVLPSISRVVFDYCAFALLLMLILKIGFMLKKASTFQNMYLISYLCITEILPVMFFYRIYFQVGYFLNL